jgi:hypothetical protein
MTMDFRSRLLCAVLGHRRAWEWVLLDEYPTHERMICRRCGEILIGPARISEPRRTSYRETIDRMKGRL